jgi:hypothetical protein
MTSTRDRRGRRPSRLRTPDEAGPEKTKGDAVHPAHGSRRAAAVVLAAFPLIFAALAGYSFTQTSATWDEPIHLTAGYAALTQRDFSVDPSHPPLLRAWASLPAVLMDDVTMRPVPAAASTQLQWLPDAYLFAHRFMYLENDADRLLYAARFMMVTLGILLGVFVFWWARQSMGLVPAVAALAAYTIEPNLLAHSSLVTTDLGLTCFVFGSVFFTWRVCRRFNRIDVAGLAICVALAMASKFSAVLLAPVVVALLALGVRDGSITFRRAATVACLLGLLSFAGIWASYGFRYLPGPSDWRFTLHETDLARRAPSLAALVEWVDERHLLPNAFTQGLLYTQVSTNNLPAFLAGDISEDGWWYYFPAAFLMKTPVVLLLFMAAGALTLVRTSRSAAPSPLPWRFVAIPVMVYLGVAMASGVNIGLRHVLPIFPFLLLAAAAAVHELHRLRPRATAVVLPVLLLAGVAEVATAYPHPLTFFNQFVGGPENGHRYLADSNLGWGQSLKLLKTWMDRNKVTHVNLAYFGQADPAYYGISCTHLPGGPTFTRDATARPRLPGYVAISGTMLTGVYAPPTWRLFYRPFQDLVPVATLGNSMKIYWIEEWPAAIGSRAGSVAPETHRSLADALVFGLRWPQHAVFHYREYLTRRPGDVDAMVDYAVALVAIDRIEDGLAMLREAVAIAPGHARAQLTLAKALFGGRDLEGAVRHARKAAAAAPQDPEVHHLFGRMNAVRGRFEEAARDFQRVLEIQPEHPEARQYLDRVMTAMRPGAERSARR